ncbi:hypothetical protein AKJ16_DCAP24367 [Drosera capensis]
MELNKEATDLKSRTESLEEMVNQAQRAIVERVKEIERGARERIISSWVRWQGRTRCLRKNYEEQRKRVLRLRAKAWKMILKIGYLC